MLRHEGSFFGESGAGAKGIAEMATRAKKAEMIAQIKGKLDRAQIVIATDYRGLTVANISDLRQKLRQEGIEYHVVKNTLAGFAAQQAGRPDLSKYLEGPTALVFGYGDVAQPAKILQEYLRTAETPLRIKGGLLGDKAVSAEDIATLAKLPPKNDLIAKMLGLIQSPIGRLITVLNANIQGLVTVLEGRVKQLEKGGQNG